MNNILPEISEKIAVVIPCYNVKNHINDVLIKIPDFVDLIFVVDDACPQSTGEYVKNNFSDKRIHVAFHEVNKGVGGAVKTGYQLAIESSADIIVKIDGDGQMDPELIPFFILPIILGESDYTKGNRFYNLDNLKHMPFIRLLGNSILSFLTKFSTGYWNLFDPTNGYTAIHYKVASLLPFNKISNRYFFETDILFRLNTLRAVVLDIPMNAKYGSEISGLSVSKIVGEFVYKHIRNTFKRIFYNYYLRDFSIASIELPLGFLMVFFGLSFGVSSWYESMIAGVESTSGTVMLSALPTLIGVQLLLAFTSYDIASIPSKVLHLSLINLNNRKY